MNVRETFRHRCGAQSSKLVDGRKVVGRFDSYTFPPSLNKIKSDFVNEVGFFSLVEHLSRSYPAKPGKLR